MRAAAITELRRRVQQAVDETAPGAIPPEMTFRQWCEHLAVAGLKIDNHPFSLQDRPAIAPLYDAIPTTRAEANGRTIVIQKASQIGMTVWEVLADIYMAKKWAPLNLGLYLPSQAHAKYKSEHRFMPIIRSNPLLYRELLARPVHERKAGSEGNIMTRRLGTSMLLFMWTSGKVSTEGFPLDVVSLDEVQGMTLDAIDKVKARTGGSDVRFTMLLSTANDPGLDVNKWYLRGDQRVWHTECPHCGAMSDLSDPAGIFPDLSIGYSSGGNYKPIRGPGGESLRPPENEYVWACPDCRQWIKDPQRGRYIVQNPDGDPKVESYLIPRTVSPQMTPREMVTDFRHATTGDQRKSFYNRTLARPYIDADQIPITIPICEAAAAEGKRVGLDWETEAQPGCSYYMGIDQMAGYCCVVVMKRLPDGRQGVVHVEAAYANGKAMGSWERCGELMRRFRPAVCVVEQNPNADAARAFALRFPGKVFLNTAFIEDDMLRWFDQLSRSDRRTAKDDRSRYELHLNQYKLMQRTLYRIRDLQCLFPDPGRLEQDMQTPNGIQRGPILRDMVWHHYTKTALVMSYGPAGKDGKVKERKPRGAVHKVEIDPHFSYATMLCNAAWAREQNMGSVFIPGRDPVDPAGAPLPVPPPPAAVETAAADLVRHANVAAAVGSSIPAPVVPPSALAMLAPKPAAATCGSCQEFKAESQFCPVLAMKTTASNHKCLSYVYAPRKESAAEG